MPIRYIQLLENSADISRHKAMPSPFFRKVGFKPYLTEKNERLSVVETHLLYYLCFDKPLKRFIKAQ